MIATRYDDNDFTSMVLSAVESIVYKREINYLFKNDSYFDDYDSENETYAANENNQFLNGNFTDRNDSAHLSDEQAEDINNYWALLAIILVIGTACGNILVCLAIAWEKRLQNVTNYFLASLAITDLMVAVLVMPLGIVTLFRGKSKRTKLNRVFFVASCTWAWISVSHELFDSSTFYTLKKISQVSSKNAIFLVETCFVNRTW